MGSSGPHLLGHSDPPAGTTRRAVLRAGVVAAIGAALIGDSAEVSDATSGEAVSRSAMPGPGGGGLSTQVVFRAETNQRRVALTFDDGPTLRWTPVVLELLARHQVLATFFLVGARAARHPELVHAEHSSGHQIGNHTWNHLDLVKHRPDTVAGQLRRTHTLLAELTPAPPTVLRPPWGRIDPVGLLAAGHLQSRVVMWSHLIRGAHARSDTSASLATITPGAIVLAHDGGPTPTSQLYRQLDRFIPTLQDRGYTFVTVDRLLSGS